MTLKIYEDSKNYTCQVIKLPLKQKVEGLDNLVRVNVQGNDCLISKDSNENELYLFFPAECEIDHKFLYSNNLYRHSNLNEDETKKGFFEDSKRVKTIKFRGIISSGFVIPLFSLLNCKPEKIDPNDWAEIISDLKSGNEFNSIYDLNICKKYIRSRERNKGMSNPKTKLLDQIVDSKFAPEHLDTSHLLKNCHKLDLSDYIAVTYKLHGTSARYYRTLVKTRLSVMAKVAKFFGVKVQEEEYNEIAASRRVIKSVGYEQLPNKNHYYVSGDLWSEVGKEFFQGKLNKGEAVYCEIIGKTYSGEAIQHGYSYGLEKPKVYIYRISNINSQGIEVDLSYLQMKERSKQLGVDYCPEYFYGTLKEFLKFYWHEQPTNSRDIEPGLNDIFYNKLLEKMSILDSSVYEEGFCVRKDTCNKPEIFKIKSKNFLIHEGHSLDKEVKDIEEEQVI